jgi:hypothetical protein
MEGLGFQLRSEATLQTMTEEVITKVLKADGAGRIAISPGSSSLTPAQQTLLSRSVQSADILRRQL